MEIDQRVLRCSVKPRSVALLSAQQLAGLSTPRLLAYRDNLLSLEQSADSSDWTPAELEAVDPTEVSFKDDARWVKAYTALKAVLEGREHVQRRG